MAGSDTVDVQGVCLSHDSGFAVQMQATGVVSCQSVLSIVPMFLFIWTKVLCSLKNIVKPTPSQGFEAKCRINCTDFFLTFLFYTALHLLCYSLPPFSILF